MRTSLGHNWGITKTTKRQKRQMRTNLGQAEGKKRNYEGPR